MRQRIWINGFEWWINTSTNILSETKDSNEGINLNSNHLTPNERTQVYNQLNYDNDKR